MAEQIGKEVKFIPDKLALKDNEPLEVTVENIGKRTLAYKLKTTRPLTVKPNKAFGSAKAGSNDKFKVTYKPQPNDKPFAEQDRVTVMVQAMTDSNMKPELFWKTPDASNNAYRHVLNLVKASEADKKKETTKGAPEKEEDAKSEESEAETESGTESGSEATESEA